MKRRLSVFGHISAFIAFAFSLSIPWLITGCGAEADSGNGRGNQRLIPAVEAVQARFGSLPLTERLSGLVKGKNQVELFPQISAIVAEVYVNNGNLVKAGDPLVRLRDIEFRGQLNQARANHQIALAQLKQAEAELQRVNSELKRNVSLSDKNLISETEFETIKTQAIAAEADAELARARVEQAQANVEESQEELSRTVITAPIDGTVGNRNAEVGMLVNPNRRLFTLGQLDSVRVEVILSDRMYSYIKEDQRTEILSRSLPFGLANASVTRISPFLHPITHSTVAEIDLANPEGSLKPGMFVTVDIFYGETEQATLVPLSAIWENQATAITGLFVCRDSITGEPTARLDNSSGGAITDPLSFEFVPIEVIARGAMSAGVRGIEPGSWIVTIGQDLLSADSATARVRLVNWKWVEELQRLQREDLIEDLIQPKKSSVIDSSLIGTVIKNNGNDA